MIPSRDLACDESFITRQRRSLLYRRPLGRFHLLMACIVGAYGAWVWVNHNPRDIIGNDPLSKTAFEIGLTTGSVWTLGLLVVIANFIFGAGVIFGGRKTRLLLKYHDLLRECEHVDTP